MTDDGSRPEPAARVTWAERLLPFTVAACALLLFASELMTTFELTPQGGEPLADQSASDRHHYALAILAVFAIGALVVAIAAGSKPAASAVAACGVIALFIFLIVDLPDANAVGTLDDARESFFDAEAIPQAGFWLELVGALGLAVTGGALATLAPEQLQALRWQRLGRRAGEEPPRPEGAVLYDAAAPNPEAPKTEQTKDTGRAAKRA